MAQPAAKPSKGLGKGLSALMSEASAAPASAKGATAGEGGIATLPVDSLSAGAFQPRRHFDEEVLLELADSIEKNGIMQPIVVRESGKAGRYEIIAGERRWRAAKLAKLKHVPVIVREASDAVALELALVENIQRQDLNPLEEAEGYARLMEEFSYTQEKLASTVGKSRSHVANLLRLRELPEKLKKLIDKGELSMGHARALLTAEDPEKLAAIVVAKGLSVRQTEELVRNGGEESAPKAKAPKGEGSASGNASGKSEDILQIEQMLSENLGLRVSLNPRGSQAGEVVIGYDTLSQLDDVLRRLGGSI
ncbi:MAG: ParB/RepB/Spo0J family partition protein [Alphaproteobacteria bacterium]